LLIFQYLSTILIELGCMSFLLYRIKKSSFILLSFLTILSFILVFLQTIGGNAVSNVWSYKVFPEARGEGETFKIKSPTLIPINDVKQVSAGKGTTFFVKNNGTLWVAGENDDGLLGSGVNLGSASAGKQVSGISNVKKALSAESAGNAIALRNDGTVMVWGRNQVGQMARAANTTVYQTPQVITALTGITDIAQTKSGETRYALKNGEIYAWGENSRGQLGDGTTINKTVPTKVLGLTGVTAIGGMLDGGLALTSAGKLYTWGDNSKGQLGQDTTSASVNTAISLKNTNGTDMTGFSQLNSDNGDGPRVLRNGAMYYWGQINSGTTITNTANPGDDCQKVNGGVSNPNGQTFPCRSPLTTGTTSIGGHEPNVLTIKNNKVYSSGTNTDGDAGTGTISNTVFYEELTTLSNIVSVEHGGNSGFAVTNTGTVYGFGVNNDYRLGLTQNTTISSDYYDEVTNSLQTCKEIVGNSNYFCITQQDELLSWGVNVWGGLGQGPNTPAEVSNIDLPSPVYTSSTNSTRVGNVKKVIARGRNTFIIKNDGTVWFAGLDNRGSAGNGSGQTDCRYFCEITYFSANNITIEDLDSSENTILALDKNNKQAYFWGANTSDSSGLGSSSTSIETPTVLPFSDVIDIQVRNLSNTYILRENIIGGNAQNTIFAAGTNTECQLGNGNANPATGRVSIANNVKALNHDFALFALQDDTASTLGEKVLRWGPDHEPADICTPQIVAGINNITSLNGSIITKNTGDGYILLSYTTTTRNVSGSTVDFVKIDEASSISKNNNVFIKSNLVDVLQESGIASLTYTCVSAIAGTTTNCTFTLPANTNLPTGFTMGLGTTTTSGKCTSNTASLVTCSGIPVGTTAGVNSKIYAKVASGTSIDTGEKSNIFTLTEDTDNDGLTNQQELDISDTDPLDSNSDNPNTPSVDEGSDSINDGDQDFDGDGIKTKDEINVLKTDPNVADSNSTQTTANEAGNNKSDGLEDFDGDGLSNFFELYVSNTNPFQTDSNNNGTNDGNEDSDGDGLKNSQEQLAGTDPFKVDTDGDKLSDADEINKTLTDPKNVNSNSALTPNVNESTNTINDNLEDLDGDTYNNEVEIAGGSDPASANSIPVTVLQDEDIPSLLVSCVAIIAGSPTSCQFALPAGKALPNTGGFLLTVGNVPIASASPSACVLTNATKIVNCTNVSTESTVAGQYPIKMAYSAVNTPATTLDLIPQALSGGFIATGEQATLLDNSGNNTSDTDGDGLPDTWEQANNLDKNSSAGANGKDGDPDGDGLTNQQELQYGTSPNDNDSDDDGLKDAFEIFKTRSDPKDSDSDSAGTVANNNDNGINDALEDFDADGFTNTQEFTDGTDPLDSTDNKNNRRPGTTTAGSGSANGGTSGSGTGTGVSKLVTTGGRTLVGAGTFLLFIGIGSYFITKRRHKNRKDVYDIQK
jgi:alpha-tubulin suppressor-like RCC1 family protein